MLGGFMRDTAPAFGAFEGGLREVLFSAAREHRCDGGDTEFGGFFDGPFEVIEFEDREQEMEWKRGFGFACFVSGRCRRGQR